MLINCFLGRKPSHFQMNKLVKLFIISEVFIWSAWNFVIPIIAIFAASQIKGGNIEIAAMAFSVCLITRVIFELFCSKYLARVRTSWQLIIIISGLVLMSISYLGFAFANTVSWLFIFYALVGMGIGIATPIKNSLFSTHLDKNKEVAEWGIYDALVFVGMAISSAIGGFIAHQFGFQILFIISAVINLLGIIPYLLYAKQKKIDLTIAAQAL